MKVRYLFAVLTLAMPAFLVSASQERGETTAWMLSQGSISDVSEGGESFKMKDTMFGQTLTYTTNQETKVKLGDKTKPGDLRNGDEATIVYYRNGEKYYASQISTMKVSKGKIESLEDGSIKCKDSDNKSQSWTTNNKTSVSINGKRSQLSQLKEGDTCVVAYQGTTAQYIDCRRE